MFFGRNGEHKATFGSIAQKTPAVSATRGRLNGHKILPAQTKKSFLHGIMRRLDVSRDFLGVTDNTIVPLKLDFAAQKKGGRPSRPF